ncbi:GNAT family N-acetyltransferase [Aquimarina sp. ERC-38]|uniref:GNAT family N-acetyltransferase n=1 Tax=Aquimarina sp. ERC-38 TaxID=2949996 RepID=UPI002246AF74|nr:GNAT family N-acetyltransferase [Aquimarina sp. ERC-38]UZO80005.1 GNAT family N-acetyltransferase [Aquimarina sp. ERC-38]
MEIKIREAKPSEFVNVYNLIKEFSEFIKTPEKVKITPEQMVMDEKYFKCLIATNGNMILGFATYFFSYYSWTGKAIYLDDLYVPEKYRNQGIGSKLFDKIIEIGKTEDCCKMKWQVSNWNEKAQDFYKDRGAIIDDVEVNCDLELN